jgi:16S rRNA C1402 (ribose-2'-O) methylase RsmI
VRLDPSKEEEALGLLTDLNSAWKGRSVLICTSILKLLESGLGRPSKDVVAQFKEDCHKVFPLAVVFVPPSKSPESSHVMTSVNDNNLQEA